MGNLNVLYTVDVNYYKQFMVSLLSLLETNKDKNLIKVFIIEEGFLEDQRKRLENLQKEYSNFSFAFISTSFIYEQIKEYHLVPYRNSYVPFLRLFYSLVIDDIDFLLYLDADTIVVDSIDLSSLEFAGCVKASLDHMASSYKNSLPIELEHYYNSGVLFINHSSFKRNHALDAILKLIKTNQSVLQFPDQDILNMALRGKFETLPLNYNLYSTDVYFKRMGLLFYKRFGISDFYSKKEIKEALKHPVILHATDLYGIRPWHKNTIHPFNELYDFYLEKIFGYVEKEPFSQEQSRLAFRLDKTKEILRNLNQKR